MNHPIATMVLPNGTVTIELYPDSAPNTTASFISLANRGLFNDRKICRVVPGFVLQPSYTSFDDPECDYLIEGEYEENGIPNPIRFEKGILAMGGIGKYASGSSFFITLSDDAAPRLQGKFAAFGRVTSGMQYIEGIEHSPLKKVEIPDAPEVVVLEPETEIRIRSVQVETFGIDYPEPVKTEYQE